MNSVFSTPKMNAVTPNTLEEEISKYRRQKVNWASYFQSHMITQVEFRLIHEFDRGDKLNRQKILEENRHELGTSLVALLEKVSKDETIHYILILIDEMLEEDHGRIESGTSSRKILPLNGPFLTLLNGHDGFIVYMCARIFARIASWSTLLLNQQDLKNYLLWLRDRLNSPGNSYIHTVVDCIQLVLRVDTYRGAFMSVDGMSAILKNLKSVKNFQIEYKLIFCIWVLTFNPEVAERMNKYNTIPVLADIFTGTETDKITRIILGVFRNLVEQPHDRLVIREHCITMVQHKVLKQLSVLEQKPFDDDDVVEDIKFLSAKLQASVQDLSSFDEYVAEVKSGRLEWSPVHRSAQFWRENADRLNEKKYELLRILIHLLETSRDPLVLGVASYDIGEYVRHYPRGKGVIEELGGKQVVMQLLSHDNPSVRYEALIALQKIMVQNWGYLGKQMEKDQN